MFRIGQYIVCVIAGIIGKGLVNPKAKRLICRVPRSRCGKRKPLAERLAGLAKEERLVKHDG